MMNGVQVAPQTGLIRVADMAANSRAEPVRFRLWPTALGEGLRRAFSAPHALALAMIAWTVLTSLGCAPSRSNHQRQDVDQLVVAMYHPTGTFPLVRFEGELAGTANPDRTECFYFENGSGRTAIIWPEGVTAHANPLRVTDGKGHVVRVGDHAVFGGAYSGQSGQAVLGCGTPQAAVTVYFQCDGLPC
jgi:hypothetical protein